MWYVTANEEKHSPIYISINEDEYRVESVGKHDYRFPTGNYPPMHNTEALWSIYSNKNLEAKGIEPLGPNGFLELINDQPEKCHFEIRPFLGDDKNSITSVAFTIGHLEQCPSR